jgi:hypothetical protein
VIHYKNGDSILRSSREFFAKGQPLQVRFYGEADPPDVVVKRAVSRLGERDYHLIFNNCEHFATWCKTGKHESQQVNQAVAASLVGGMVGMAINPLLAAPALAAAGIYGVGKFQQQMLQAQSAQDPQVALQALGEGLRELQKMRQTLEPQLDRVLREAYQWHCTAQLAIKRQRDDLSKAALLKKYPLKQEALNLQAQLDEIQGLERQLQTLIQDLQQCLT